MQLKTILHQVEKHKSFAHAKERRRRIKRRPALEITIHPRKNNRPVCSGCGERGPQYDRQASRRFEFVPLWGIAVFFVAREEAIDGCLTTPGGDAGG